MHFYFDHGSNLHFADYIQHIEFCRLNLEHFILAVILYYSIPNTYDEILRYGFLVTYHV